MSHWLTDISLHLSSVLFFLLSPSWSILFSPSLPRCPCDDIHWFWFPDDVPASLWFQQHRFQHVGGGVCHPVVHHHLWGLHVHRPGPHRQLLHYQRQPGDVSETDNDQDRIGHVFTAVYGWLMRIVFVMQFNCHLLGWHDASDCCVCFFQKQGSSCVAL